MRRIPLLLLILACAFASDAAAQDGRPARDSIRMAEVAEEETEPDDPANPEDPADPEEAAEDTVPQPPANGPYARSGGSGPFTVQTSGEVAPRPRRGEVVWVNAPARATADSARRDTARTGQRVTSGQTARRDTASAARPASRDTARTGQRVTSGQTTRRDTASAARPASRDSARTGQRVTSGQTARRDTASAARPASRDSARTGQRVTSGQTTRRDTASARPQNRPGATTPATGRTGSTATASGRPRAHTVAAGETFYAIARRYGVTAAQLRALNPDVDMDALEVGDQLRLPAGARDSRASTQTPARPQPQPARPGGQAQTPRGARSHTVAAGETLFGIARRYGVTVDAIRRANDMESDQVRTGQRLVIPPAS